MNRVIHLINRRVYSCVVDETWDGPKIGHRLRDAPQYARIADSGCRSSGTRRWCLVVNTPANTANAVYCFRLILAARLLSRAHPLWAAADWATPDNGRLLSEAALQGLRRPLANRQTSRAPARRLSQCLPSRLTVTFMCAYAPAVSRLRPVPTN